VRKSTIVVLSVLVGVSFVHPLIAEVKKPQNDGVICDRKFDIFSQKGQEKLGAYRIRAASRKAAGRIEISETMTLTLRGKPIAFKSTVIYGAPEPINFKAGNRLVRGKPDKTGQYDIKLFGRGAKENIASYRFDKNNQLVSMDLFGKFRVRPVKADEAPPADDDRAGFVSLFNDKDLTGWDVKINDWNEYRIIAKGPKLTLMINGVVMCEAVDNEKGKAALDGIIALQVHPGPPMKIQFKDILLKKLTP